MKFIYPFFFFLFLSCNTNVEKQSDLNIYRFENILFNSNYENIEKNRNIWEGEIGQFAPAYYSFLSVENDIDLIESDLLSFVENSDMREVYDSIKVKFSINVLELLIAHRAELAASSALLDYGCGSGVLSLAAIALHRDAAAGSGSAGGADPLPPVVADPLRTYGVEVNEAALGAARRNALLNGCDRCASFGYAWELPSLSGDRGLVDVAVANMMPGPLLSVIPELIARTREDGLLLISGFRAEDVPALRRALEPHFAVPAEPALTRVGRADEAGGEWLAFVCRRRVGTRFDLAELSASAV